jgi:hypothetical protein
MLGCVVYGDGLNGTKGWKCPPFLRSKYPRLPFPSLAAVEATGRAISRTRLFELIRTGEIDARKVGRRTVVMADSLHEYLQRQPKAAGGNP